MKPSPRHLVASGTLLATMSMASADIPVEPQGVLFTKIANNGTTLPVGAGLGSGPNDWACTRHNASGLVFEVKVATPMALRHGANTYSWFNSNGAVNGGQAGTSNGGACSGSACDTQAYVAAVNASGLCGATGWRMPTRRELQLVLGTGPTGTGASMADPTFFPNMAADAYWTGTNFAANPEAAWTVEMDDGRASWGTKNRTLRAMVVR